jgi:hypothetical protein
MDILARIKQLAWSGRLIFTIKAEEEMDRDAVTRDDVVEALLNARRIDKRLRSKRPDGLPGPEYLYVIRAETFSGTLLYTKGKIIQSEESEQFYILISAKRSA